MNEKRPYKKTSHWSFRVAAEIERDEGAGAGLGAKDDFSQFFDVCVLEFDKESRLRSPAQLDAAVSAIEQARARARGATVMLFVHGWHNNADWDCGNFESFRRLTRSMAYRESERYQGQKHLARRVVGIYLGWEGGVDSGQRGSGIADWLGLNYWNRDKRARTLAAGKAMREAMAEIITATKDPGPGDPDNSPLIMAGHSMGGLILEAAVRHWVVDSKLPDWPAADPAGSTRLVAGDTAVSGPDVVLLLNPASGAADTQLLINGLATRRWRKMTTDDSLAYEPPLVISITSEGDRAVGWGFRAANVLKDWPKSAGFTKRMHTHNLRYLSGTDVNPAGTIDYGQFWHAVGFDEATLDKPSPTVTIALPNDGSNAFSHNAYQLVARNPDVGSPMWIFQVPDHLIDDHSDIFNFKATPLFLALAQAAGAVASLNYDWADLFAELPGEHAAVDAQGVAGGE